MRKNAGKLHLVSLLITVAAAIGVALFLSVNIRICGITRAQMLQFLGIPLSVSCTALYAFYKLRFIDKDPQCLFTAKFEPSTTYVPRVITIMLFDDECQKFYKKYRSIDSYLTKLLSVKVFCASSNQGTRFTIKKLSLLCYEEIQSHDSTASKVLNFWKTLICGSEYEQCFRRLRTRNSVANYTGDNMTESVINICLCYRDMKMEKKFTELEMSDISLQSELKFTVGILTRMGFKYKYDVDLHRMVIGGGVVEWK